MNKLLEVEHFDDVNNIDVIYVSEHWLLRIELTYTRAVVVGKSHSILKLKFSIFEYLKTEQWDMFT